MALFGPYARRGSKAGHWPARRDRARVQRQGVPARFEAVSEALSSKRSATAACAVVGRAIAGDGATMGEALDGLRATYRSVTGGKPDFEASAALAEAWAETTLDYLHQLSCQDPMTGLASLAHVRTRVEELYRHAQQAGTQVQSTHALVVVAMTFPRRRDPAEHPLTRALHLVRVAEVIRSAYSGETIGRLGADSAVVVVRREANLGASVSLLREFLTALDLDSARVRVWIEGLPASAYHLGLLLDDLGRPRLSCPSRVIPADRDTF